MQDRFPTPDEDHRMNARQALEARYASLLTTDSSLNRALVSFQGSRNRRFTRWFRYKEAFSAEVVTYLLKTWWKRRPGRLLDPFAGTGTACLTACDLGWRSTGIELLPVGISITEAMMAARRVQVDEFRLQVSKAMAVDFAHCARSSSSFPHLTITQGAFPADEERALLGYLDYCQRHLAGPILQLFRFAAFCILEEISYTRKDGQYLRWDSRSGRSRGTFSKGSISPFREALFCKLSQMASDLEDDVVQASLFQGQVLLDVHRQEGGGAGPDLLAGSCFDILPTLEGESVDCIITSPPYANRYDYTRTYALELALLGYDDEAVKRLRQEMLSCTVENRPKDFHLADLYAFSEFRQDEEFKRVAEVIEAQEALQEVLSELTEKRQVLNNDQVIRMLRNYFFELSFVIMEAYRLLSPGGLLMMINDNVRYAGVEVPVDCILADIAEQFGFLVRSILVLPSSKGNSSQQMAEHGRVELRKCIYIWEKASPSPQRGEEERFARAASALNALLCSRWIGEEIHREQARLEQCIQDITHLSLEEQWDEMDRWNVDATAFAAASSPFHIFCHPRLLQRAPRLIRYYRLLSLLSEQEASVLFGRDLTRYEQGLVRVSSEQAEEIATGINALLSHIIREQGEDFNQVEFVNTSPWLSLGPALYATWRTAPLNRSALQAVRGLLLKELKRSVPLSISSTEVIELADLQRIKWDAACHAPPSSWNLLVMREPACLILADEHFFPHVVISVSVSIQQAVAQKLLKRALTFLADVRGRAPTAVTMLLGCGLDTVLVSRASAEESCSAVFETRDLLVSDTERARFLSPIRALLEGRNW